MLKLERTYWFIIALVIVLTAMGMDRAVASSLTIENSDFEALDPLSCRPLRMWSCAEVPGWTMSGDGGTFYALKAGEYVSLPSASLTDLASVAYTNAGSLFTDHIYYPDGTAAELTADHIYTLTADAGNRSYVNGFSTYAIELWAGGVVLSPDILTLPTPDDGYFETATLTYVASSDDPFLGQLLGIRLISYGPQVNWDNVRLSNATVPEPATLLLLGSGLMGLAGFGRKKIKA